MARKLREEVPGGAYHVYARGNDRRQIYLDHDDRRIYLGMLERVVARQRWRCLAYCLMDNHVHLLMETAEPNLAHGMQLLHGRYAQIHNARHARSGHLFQGRYGSVRIRSDAHLQMVAAYIARNPVDAGLRASPGDWEWSSYSATVDGRAPQWLDSTRLLEYFASAGGDARCRYAELTEERS